MNRPTGTLTRWANWMYEVQDEMSGYCKNENDPVMLAYWKGNVEGIRLTMARLEAEIKFPSDEEEES